MLLAFVGGVVAAVVGGGASASDAESVTTRGGEVVAREAPGDGQAGIAVLHGNDHVQLMAEREGWSEILLPDGRRAWVPSAELARGGDALLARTPHPTEIATPLPQNGATDGVLALEKPSRELGAEVTRLRGVVDELRTWRASLPEDAGAPTPASPVDTVPWAISGVALVLGLLVGGAWERHRSRRDRSLKF